MAFAATILPYPLLPPATRDVLLPCSYVSRWIGLCGGLSNLRFLVPSLSTDSPLEPRVLYTRVSFSRYVSRLLMKRVPTHDVPKYTVGPPQASAYRLLSCCFTARRHKQAQTTKQRPAFLTPLRLYRESFLNEFEEKRPTSMRTLKTVIDRVSDHLAYLDPPVDALSYRNHEFRRAWRL